MLVAAKDMHGDDIDFARRYPQNGNEEKDTRRIMPLFEESDMHNRCSVEDDGLDNGDICFEFGDDMPEAIDDEMHKRLIEASKAGLSEEGKQRLSN